MIPAVFPYQGRGALLAYQDAIALWCRPLFAQQGTQARERSCEIVRTLGVESSIKHSIETEVFRAAKRPLARPPYRLGTPWPADLSAHVARFWTTVDEGKIHCYSLPRFGHQRPQPKPLRNPREITTVDRQTGVVEGLWPVTTEKHVLLFMRPDIEARIAPPVRRRVRRHPVRPAAVRSRRAKRTTWSRSDCEDAMRQAHARSPFQSQAQLRAAVGAWGDSAEGAPPSQRTYRAVARKLWKELESS